MTRQRRAGFQPVCRANWRTVRNATRCPNRTVEGDSRRLCEAARNRKEPCDSAAESCKILNVEKARFYQDALSGSGDLDHRAGCGIGRDDGNRPFRAYHIIIMTDADASTARTSVRCC